MTVEKLAYDLFVILSVGLISGIVSKRLGFSMLAGYLLAGAVSRFPSSDVVAARRSRRASKYRLEK